MESFEIDEVAGPPLIGIWIAAMRVAEVQSGTMASFSPSGTALKNALAHMEKVLGPEFSKTMQLAKKLNKKYVEDMKKLAIDNESLLDIARELEKS